MKNLVFLFVFAFTFAPAQYVVEDNDITENARDVMKQTIALDLNAPLEI